MTKTVFLVKVDPMNQSVDNVIDRLSEIEARAVKISDETENKIRYLADRMEQKKKAYDEKLLKETADRLNRLGNGMNEQMESEITRLQQEADQAMKEMQEKFTKQLEEITDQLVRSMIKV